MLGRRRRPRRRIRSAARRAGETGADACSLDCLDCNPLLVSVVLATAAGYRATPRVTGVGPAARPLLRLVRSYQLNVSAHRPAVCHLEPTCSNFGYDALRARGPAGLLPVARRLRECARVGRERRGAGA